MLPAARAATEMIEPDDDPPAQDSIDRSSDQFFMSQALREARKAFRQEEVPVGAVVVHEGHIIGRAANQVELLRDATAHAEMLALTQAQSAIGDWRLTHCDVFVTKEPCPMCAGAIVHCRIRRVIFGCPDEKSGAAGGFINLLQNTPLNHHCLITSGVLAKESAALLKAFFRLRREAPPPSGPVSPPEPPPQQLRG
ncbi:MAG TPA: tRNA adenosine(34) deaminase TadA [Verrucomicrobiales bacterium]|nr:tRNA adenosine(34) deaminase TadA [Verrucomicrobiales bacterium]